MIGYVQFGKKNISKFLKRTKFVIFDTTWAKKGDRQFISISDMNKKSLNRNTHMSCWWMSLHSGNYVETTGQDISKKDILMLNNKIKRKSCLYFFVVVLFFILYLFIPSKLCILPDVHPQYKIREYHFYWFE